MADTMRNIELVKLPDGWRWVRLGEVTRVFAGSAAPQSKEYFDINGPPFVRVSDLGKYQRTTCLVEVQDKLSAKAIEKCPLVLAKKGSILFPKSGAAVGTNNRAILGKDAYIVSHLMAIEPGAETISLWLYWVFLQLDMTEYSDNTAYPSLKQSTVQKIEIPLPPISEQNRIALILEEQMAAVEKARAAAVARLEAAKALPAAYLREVFQSEEARKWKHKPLGLFAIKVGSGLTPRGGHTVYGKSGIPLIRSQNVHMNIFEPAGLAYISKEIDEEMSNSRVNPGDVLLNITGASIGRVCVVPSELCPANVNQHVSIIRCNHKINPYFLSFYIATPNFQNFIMGTQAGATRQALTKTIIEQFEIPVLDLEEQSHIVATIRNNIAAEVNILRTIQQELDSINALPAALLRRAFTGGL